MSTVAALAALRALAPAEIALATKAAAFAWRALPRLTARTARTARAASPPIAAASTTLVTLPEALPRTSTASTIEAAISTWCATIEPAAGSLCADFRCAFFVFVVVFGRSLCRRSCLLPLSAVRATTNHWSWHPPRRTVRRRCGAALLSGRHGVRLSHGGLRRCVRRQVFRFPRIRGRRRCFPGAPRPRRSSVSGSVLSRCLLGWRSCAGRLSTGGRGASRHRRTLVLRGVLRGVLRSSRLPAAWRSALLGSGGGFFRSRLRLFG